jgi:ATP-dependent DNA ligase
MPTASSKTYSSTAKMMNGDSKKATVKTQKNPQQSCADDKGSSAVAEPMLAHEFVKHAKKLRFPCFVQPKLDGVRVVVSAAGGARTRTGNEVPPEACGGALARIKDVLPQGVMLDGEVYSHGIGFNELASAFKRGGESLEYHVYDIYDACRPRMGFEERLELLTSMWLSVEGIAGKKVQSVETLTAASMDDVERLHDAFVSDGYEGAMARDAAAPYEPGKRSTGLLKLKAFKTAEFRIVDVVEAQGADRGTAVFVCDASATPAMKPADEERGRQEKPPNIFNVRMASSREERRRYLEMHQRDPSSIVGLFLTVKYQELTARGVPRFPVGVAIRDYE